MVRASRGVSRDLRTAPVPPPDCQNAVILQATLGHADGLTFGGAPAAEHYVRSASEFQEHVRAVSRLLGRRILQCRGVFLGGSDVLRRPEDEVVGYLEAIRGTFAGDPDASTRDEVHAFLDDFSPPRPDARAFRRFKEHRLHRVSLGVESGDPSIRRLYGKSWADEDLADVVADIKGAGLALSLVVLVGAGERRTPRPMSRRRPGSSRRSRWDAATSSRCSTPRRSAIREEGRRRPRRVSPPWPAHDCPISTRRSRAASSRSGPSGG